MVERGGGSIVTISSGTSTIGESTRVAYGVSKAAINQLTRHLATRYGRDGIRANAIAPGFILTETAQANVPEEIQERLAAGNPTRRLGRPEDIAARRGLLVQRCLVLHQRAGAARRRRPPDRRDDVDVGDRRVALVTGASRGIGRCGAWPWPAAASTSPSPPARCAKGRAGPPSSSLAATPPSPIAAVWRPRQPRLRPWAFAACSVPMDLMDRQSIYQVADQVLDQWGRVDVLFNNAIYQGPGTMDRMLDLPHRAGRALPGRRLPAPTPAHAAAPAPDARTGRRPSGQHAFGSRLHHAAGTGRRRWLGRGLRRGQGGLSSRHRHVPRRVLRRRASGPSASPPDSP